MKHVPLKEGSKIFVMSGRHIGKEGIIESILDGRVLIKFTEGSAQIQKSRVVAL